MKHSDSLMIRHITTGIVLFIIFGLAFIIIQPFLMVLVVAAIFAAFLSPLYNFFYNRLKKKSISAFITIVIFVLTLTVPFLIIVRALFFEAQSVFEWYAHGNGIAIEQSIRQIESVTGKLSFIDVNSLKNEVGGVARDSAKLAGVAALKTGSFFIHLFIVILVMFFILTESERTKRWLMDALPLDKRHAEILWGRATEVVSQTVRGNLLVILIQALVGISGMVLAGVSSPVLLGSLFGVLSIIPTVGAPLIWVPTALFLYASGNTVSAIFLVVWSLVTNFLVDNYVSPKIIGGSTKMHQVVILFSVLGGVQAFGIVGIILGPTIIALAMVALDIVKELAHGKEVGSAITE